MPVSCNGFGVGKLGLQLEASMQLSFYTQRVMQLDPRAREELVLWRSDLLRV